MHAPTEVVMHLHQKRCRDDGLTWRQNLNHILERPRDQRTLATCVCIGYPTTMVPLIW